MTGASNNYAFYGNLSAAAGRWNIHMAGDADNYLGGRLGIKTTANNGGNIEVGGTASFLVLLGMGFLNTRQYHLRLLINIGAILPPLQLLLHLSHCLI